MKLELGIGSMELPGSYEVASVVALGQLDVGSAPLSAGPTIAKVAKQEHRRVFGLTTRRMEGGKLDEAGLKRALTDMQNQSRSKISEIKVIDKDGRPGVTAELRHLLEKMPLVTFVMLTSSGDTAWSVIFTALDDKALLASQRKDFEQIITSIKMV